MSHFTLTVNNLYFILGLVIGVTFDIKFIVGGIVSYIIYRYILHTTQQHNTPTYTQYIQDVIKNILHID